MSLGNFDVQNFAVILRDIAKTLKGIEEELASIRTAIQNKK